MNPNAFSRKIAAATVLVMLSISACSRSDQTAVPPGEAAPGATVDAAAAPAAPAEPAEATPFSYDRNLPVAGQCALDAIGGMPAAGATITRDAQPVFAGWVANGQLQVPDDAKMVLEGESGTWAFPLATGGDRPDVAKALGTDALRSAGYNVPASLKALPAGTYKLRIVHGPDDALQGCEVNVTFSLEP